jgi:uncharacterized protein YciI
LSWLLFLRPHRAEMPFEPTDDEDRIVGEHFEYLQRLRSEGKLLLAGPSAVVGDTIGIAIFELEDEDEVRAIVAADPAVASGIMIPELRPLRLAVQ